MTTFEVYKLTDLTNNKIYIGATTEGVGVRFNHHVQRANSGSQYPIHIAIREHGKDNFKIELLEMCNDLLQMNEREAYWIAILSSTNPDIGYNSKIGGGIRLQSEETKAKIGLIHKGKIAHNRRPVLQYDCDGLLIKEFPSISEAELQTGITKRSILRVINKEATRFSKKNPYIWLYRPEDSGSIKLRIDPKEYYKDLDYIVRPSQKCMEKRSKVVAGNMGDLAIPVEQYDLKGNLIAKYRSIREAEKATKISSTTIKRYINDPDYINKVAEGRRKFNWKKGDLNDPSMKIAYKEISNKAKLKNTNIIRLINEESETDVIEITGMVNAAKFLKTDPRIIKRHILENKPYKGYYIEYKNKLTGLN